MIITRKIKVCIEEPDPDLQNELYQKLWDWRYICWKAANTLISHLYIMDSMVNMVYLTDDFKAVLADVAKNEDGILETSHQNSGYRLLSKLYKGEIPTDILTNLKNNIHSNYKKERNKVLTGERSLRNYRLGIPIPFSSSNTQIKKSENGVYTFNLFKIPFKLILGKDASWNRAILSSILSGEYKFSNSSLYWDKKDKNWFLLLCVDIPNTRLKAKKGVVVMADLSLVCPIEATCGDHIIEIGSKDEFLYSRLKIQHKLHTLQIAIRYSKGGKGRKRKLQALETFRLKERNYVHTKLHAYSRKLVNYAINNRAEKIVLVNQELKEKLAKEDEFVLRNWSYYGLKQMIEYKAQRVGIEVESQKIPTNEQQ